MEDRREGDRRIEDLKIELKADIKSVANDVSSIRDMLISEPEASPMGRALLRITDGNRRRIEENKREFEEFVEKRFDPMHDWWHQTRGAWRLVLGAGVVLGSVGAFFGILSFFGLGR